MSVQVKHEAVASILSRDIMQGVLRPGERLAGEHELAARFSVSRETVRQALAGLQREGLIEKHPGVGSFVTFEGRHLDQHLGWAQVARSPGAWPGVRSRAEVLDLEWITSPALATELGLREDRFLALDLRHRLPGEEIVSRERCRLPWRAELDDVTEDDVRAGSLTTTLSRLGLREAGWRERLELVRLDGDDAAVLDARPGEPFLARTRTSYLADGGPLEHVVSLLDPRHVRLELSCGYLP